ncbi:MAG: hypothetical protein ABTS16_23250 [Candidatus Accumulibacter phosphatis]|uniref:hypothetical protein n=1 Tax=Candidatus Accumulibacter contiguus TaxID=2954381 RepID=UPI00145DA601|nr:hypothetical protein [Candidatus Accumulibacter contiguus]
MFFIEVKDFRAYHTQNRDRIDASTGDLAREVAQKVRDSIAGIVGAGRTFDRDWTRIGKACASPKVQLVVVLWMEIDSHGLTSQAIKPRLDVHRKKLKEHLRWLNARVMLLNERVWANDIPGLQVSTIARP